MNNVSALKLRRGEHVTITGADRDGNLITETGYVVIVCRVVDSPRRSTIADPLAVTLNHGSAEDGTEVTVYGPADLTATPTGTPHGARFYGH